VSEEELINTLALALFPFCALMALIVAWLFSLRKE